MKSKKQLIKENSISFRVGYNQCRSDIKDKIINLKEPPILFEDVKLVLEELEQIIEGRS